jgi:hypothetical protein
MLKRTLATALAAVGTLAFAASAQAAYLSLGTSNTSNATTTLTGNPAGAELLLKNTNGASANAFGLYGLLSATSPTVTAAAVRGHNSSTSARGFGVWGSQAGSGTGVYGYTPSGRGVWGNSTSGRGVLGTHTSTSGTAAGVEGDSAASASSGVRGQNSGGGPGVYGQSSGYGVWGVGSYGLVGGGSTGGVWASTDNSNGSGVYGQNTGSGTGVFGAASSGVGVRGSGNYGVRGDGTTFGVIGFSGYAAGNFDGGTYGVKADGDTYGAYGFSTSGHGVDGETLEGTAVFGEGGGSAGTNGWAGYFTGNVHVTGTVSTGGTTFRIDDPRDPGHAYLQHSTVTSPDRLDIYNGNVTTDGRGFATIQMPRWFQALNRSFRYQLTILGHAPWNTQARVWNEMRDNRFTIRTNRPEVTVSWQVTGVRHDRYANAHRIQVVVPKAKAEQGKYLYPELYGKPRSAGIGYEKPSRAPRPAHKR